MLSETEVTSFMKYCVKVIAYHCALGASDQVLNVEDTAEVIAINSDAKAKADIDAKAKADTLYAMIEKECTENSLYLGFLLGLINMSVSSNDATREYIYKKTEAHKDIMKAPKTKAHKNNISIGKIGYKHTPAHLKAVKEGVARTKRNFIQEDLLFKFRHSRNSSIIWKTKSKIE